MLELFLQGVGGALAGEALTGRLEGSDIQIIDVLLV